MPQARTNGRRRQNAHRRSRCGGSQQAPAGPSGGLGVCSGKGQQPSSACREQGEGEGVALRGVLHPNPCQLAQAKGGRGSEDASNAYKSLQQDLNRGVFLRRKASDGAHCSVGNADSSEKAGYAGGGFGGWDVWTGFGLGWYPGGVKGGACGGCDAIGGREKGCVSRMRLGC